MGRGGTGLGQEMTAAALKMEPVGFVTDADELPPGTKLLFGQFTIESFLNSGGFGIVYTALNSLGRRVVVKECFPSAFCRRVGASVGPSSRARQEEYQGVIQLFIQEARNLATLDHPGIIRVHEIFEENETAYMAMDYVKGPDFLQTVEGTARPLTPKDIIAHLDRLLDAVGYLHEQGLLHRDISPDNILLNEETGLPVLIDFGAARKEVTRKSRALSGLRVVKDGYSPQEFYISGSSQAPCSDLYALAASFYHLIAQEAPKPSQERLAAIAGGEPDPLRPLAGRFRAYPAAFLQAIDKALEIFPSARLQSVAEWRAMLGDSAGGPRAAKPVVAAIAQAPRYGATAATETTARPAAPPPPRAPRMAGIARRSPGFLAGVGAAALLAAGFLVIPNGVLPPSGSSPVPVAAAAVQPEAIPVAAGAGAADALLVTSMLRLPSGLAFEIVKDGDGTKTVVSDVPKGVDTDLLPGDVLVAYAPTGAGLDGATTLRDTLTSEFAAGVSTYSFVVQRGASTIEAELRLGVAD